MTDPHAESQQSWSQQSWTDVAKALESELDQTSAMLADLRARFNAVNTAMTEQAPLTQEYQQRQEAIAQINDGKKKDVRSIDDSNCEALVHDLAALQERLDQIRITLESQLFSVKDLGPIFWQIARFTGLGIVIGAILRSLVR